MRSHQRWLATVRVIVVNTKSPFFWHHRWYATDYTTPFVQRVLRVTCEKLNNQLMIILWPKLRSLGQFPDFQFLRERSPRLFFWCIPSKSQIHCTIHPSISKSPQWWFDLHSKAPFINRIIAYRVNLTNNAMKMTGVSGRRGGSWSPQLKNSITL